MDNALAIYNQFGQLQAAASALYKSRYFSDVQDEAKAVVKVMAGAELGLPPFASMTGIHIIQGRPALGANVIATLIKNDPRYNYRVLEHTAQVCRIQFYENGEPCGVSEFTTDDARKAGTKNMDKFPKNMLFARAISNGAKWYTPGIFGGAPIYTPEELGADVDEDGNVIEGSYSHAPVAVTPPATPKANGNGATNGNEATETATGGYSDKFLQYCADNINRYTGNIYAVRNALKKQFPAETADRKEQMARFAWLKDHAAERDAAELEAAQGDLFGEEIANGAYDEV
jgi:hypothetical protein